MRLEQNTVSSLGPSSRAMRTDQRTLCFGFCARKREESLFSTRVFCDCRTPAFITSSFSASAPDLSFLDSIQEIHGCLMMRDNIIPSISLKNLRIVRGYQSFATLHNSKKKHWAIYVSMNYDTESASASKNMSPLRRLDMRSLKCEWVWIPFDIFKKRHISKCHDD